MKKVLITLVILFTISSGCYLLNNIYTPNNRESVDCPCTPDCMPGDTWCSCKTVCKK